jgi:deoxyribonuclease-4
MDDAQAAAASLPLPAALEEVNRSPRSAKKREKRRGKEDEEPTALLDRASRVSSVPLFCAAFQESMQHASCCIGSHTSKLNTFCDTFAQFVPEEAAAGTEEGGPRRRPPVTPFQIFTASPRSFAGRNPPEPDVTSAGKMVDRHGLVGFIHSAYIVNMARPDAAAAVGYLKQELELCARLRLRGVVVHVGKSLKDTPGSAREVMATNVHAVLSSACVGSPLILETPAGQGSELLTNVDDFLNFYAEFKAKHHLFKLCVDTCHVWSVGRDPSDYLNRTAERFGRESIALVHFNDSRTERGSRKDRHELPGDGTIGKEALERVVRFCASDIPMIVE